MMNINYVFIAQSLDGYIADKNGEIDFLYSVPNPEQKDLGYQKFISKIDAIIMGRQTFEKVLSFNIPWPYEIPVFVLSSSLKSLPKEYENKAEVLYGEVADVLQHIHKKGYSQLYIDGGKTVQNFLLEDQIDEITISTIPIALGGGVPLFAALDKPLHFEFVSSEVYLNAITQITYRRDKTKVKS
jgi:dihydrofolate reductase